MGADCERKYKNEEWLRDQYVRQGMSSYEIADICDCSDSTISRWLREHNIPTRGGATKDNPTVDARVDDEQWLRQRYMDEQKSLREIADICDCSDAVIYRRLNEYNISTRNRNPEVDGRLDDESWLREQYVEKRKSSGEIGDACDCAGSTVLERLHEYGIPTRPRTGLPEDERNSEQWLRQKYVDENKTLEQIADISNCSQSAVGRRLKRHGIVASNKAPDDRLDNESWLREQYIEKRKSSVEMSDVCDCSPLTVRRRLREHDIELRSSGDLTGAENENWTGGYFPYGSGWNQTKKQKVRAIDNHQCVSCGMTQSHHQLEHDCKLHVHHLLKARSVDDPQKRNAVDNLVTLCYSCHAKWEQMSVMRIKPQIDRG
jgi:transposase/5-methylcytosine-specific restriction endonuclease McrA